MIRLIADRMHTPYRETTGALDCSGNKILALYETNPYPTTACTCVDLRGLHVAPGLIDLHVHGGGGHRLWCEDSEEILAGARFLASHGVTAFATTAAFPLAELTEESQRCFDAVDAAIATQQAGAQILGIHLEGPYAAEQFCILPGYDLPIPDPAVYRETFSYSSNILRCTLSPGSEQALEFVGYLKDRGIYPSIGHAEASYDFVVRAFERGARQITHIYSAMSSVERRCGTRFPGVLESALLIDGFDVEMIANAKHLSPEMMQMIIQIKGAEHIMIVSDANEFSGHPDGPVTYLGYDGEIQDGVILRRDRKGFLGSTTTPDQMLRILVTQLGVNLRDALRMLATTPARTVGLQDSKGVLAPGYDADIIAFDDDFLVQFVMAHGRIAYMSDKLKGNHFECGGNVYVP